MGKLIIIAARSSRALTEAHTSKIVYIHTQQVYLLKHTLIIGDWISKTSVCNQAHSLLSQNTQVVMRSMSSRVFFLMVGHALVCFYLARFLMQSSARNDSKSSEVLCMYIPAHG